MNVVAVLLGALLLYLGGEMLVKHSVRLARIWGLTPLVVGLTIVAFGTSSPELAATLVAAARGKADLALGNVIGSNSANLGLILGLTAMLRPLHSGARFIRREIPFMIAVTAMLPFFLRNGTLERTEGLVLLTLMLPYFALLFGGKEKSDVESEFFNEYGKQQTKTSHAILGVAVGIVLLTLGAHVMVEGAIGLARAMGLSERVIGLTLVAFGTSLPELATAVVAALKHESDIVLGNLVGSNVFNILCVLGAVGIFQPITVDMASLWVDCAVMFGISLLILPLLASGRRLGRWEGATLFGVYVAYVVHLYR